MVFGFTLYNLGKVCVGGGGGSFDNGRARHYISKELLLSVFGGFNVYLQNTVFWQESDLYRKKI